jgi:hypothetical protein
VESTTATRPTAEPTIDTQLPTQTPAPTSAPNKPSRGRLRSKIAASLAGIRHLPTFIQGRPAQLTRALAEQLRTNFDLPDRRTPTPHPARLAGICAWAAVLGMTGLLVAGRALISMLANTAPGWFQPVIVIIGIIGITLTIGAFAAIHRPRVPWLLLTAATVPLLAGGWIVFSH